ncbi:MAG: hypothetical protein HUJ53_04280 [Holdemanella sp.]|nr:hypothetical protein [Holdemanella sp.]
MTNEKIPNSDTIAAIQEVQEMKEDPTKGKAYTDVEEMIKDLLHKNFIS